MRGVEAGGEVCRFDSSVATGQEAEILAALVGGGVAVRGFFEHRRGVEDVMMEVGASEVS